MNTVTLIHPRLNDGLETTILTPNTEDYIKRQLGEIFDGEHYKKGKIKEDMVIIDCGANVGMASLYFKDTAKIIYAIEPNPQNYEALLKNTEKFGNIKCFNIGLSAKTTAGLLKEDKGSKIAETLFGQGKEVDPVSLLSIDEFLKQNSIEHVDLLKLDVEGSEYLILPSLGFRKSSKKIDYIVGESHYLNEVGQMLIPDYLPLILDDMGFDVEFLPIDNLFLTLEFDDHENIREYELKKQTMFFAKRKELEWPN